MSKPSEPGNIVLVGFMAAGKSTVGRELERLCGYRFVDLDNVVVQMAGCSIPEIFAEEGEGRFRELETQALKSLAGSRGRVIATGGGVIGRVENWAQMRSLGPVVYLRTTWATLRKRLANSQGRPLADPKELTRVEALWRSRLQLYEQADISVDTDELDAAKVADAILRQLHIAQGNTQCSND